MGFKTAPIFLDATSQFNEKQILQINGMVKTFLNTLQEKGTQKKLSSQLQQNSIEELTARCSEVNQYFFGNTIFIAMRINLSYVQEHDVVHIGQIHIPDGYTIKSVNSQGSIDKDMVQTISMFGYFSVESDGSLYYTAVSSSTESMTGVYVSISVLLEVQE